MTPLTAVAFLGLGRMGLPMATNLARAGHRMTVWNRTPEKAERFAAEHGARAASSPAEAVAACDVVVSMPADDRALLETWTGERGGLETVRPGTLAVDMGTVSPDTVARLARLLGEKGAALVDAHVSGSVAAATSATPTIMAAGDPDAVERARDVLNSAVSAPFVRYRREAHERPGEVPVTFRLALAAKDLRLALALAGEVGAELPQIRTNLTVLESAVAEHFRRRRVSP